MSNPSAIIDQLLKQSDELKFSVVQKIHEVITPTTLKESLDAICNLENSLLYYYDQGISDTVED